jgi:hypothetical protein
MVKGALISAIRHGVNVGGVIRTRLRVVLLMVLKKQDCSSKTNFVLNHPNDVIYQSRIKIVSENISCFVHGTPSNNCIFMYQTIVSKSLPEFTRINFQQLFQCGHCFQLQPLPIPILENVFLPQFLLPRQSRKLYNFFLFQLKSSKNFKILLNLLKLQSFDFDHSVLASTCRQLIKCFISIERENSIL